MKETLNRNLIFIPLAICLVALAIFYNNCGQPLIRANEVVKGNPMLPSSQIVNALCNVIVAGHSSLNFDDCTNGVLATSFSSTLGVPPAYLNPYWTLVQAELKGLIAANGPSLVSCLNSINGLDPNSQIAQNAYSQSSFHPFSALPGMVPQTSGGCPVVYLSSSYPTPAPLPTAPPGDTIVTFDNPQPPGNPLSTYLGLTFVGTGWNSLGPFGANTTIGIYNANDTGQVFQFTPGPKLFISIQAYATNGGTLTITDDQNQTVSQFIPADNSMHTVTTNFVNPSTTVTLGFTAHWSVDYDNIIYR